MNKRILSSLPIRAPIWLLETEYGIIGTLDFIRCYARNNKVVSAVREDYMRQSLLN